MEQQETFEKVIGIIKPFVKNSDKLASADENTRLLEDLGVNSARLVDIVLAFEDEFDIAIDDEAADRVRTLGDAVTVIREQKQ
ncbi:MAG TPA: phosphopantetheine-binding protein [Gemmatimonadaceae bacterium]|jgi:Acyl carrier protein|nr:phosphopantetheine-binding protein [Gemmatimonadaceae bacterium]